MRRLTSVLLASAVFLSGLLGIGAHQHTADALQLGAACLVDHEAEHGADEGHASGPHVESSAEPHGHDCVACAASRQRAESARSTVEVPKPLPAPPTSVDPVAFHGGPAVASHGARAPPRC